jgi:integrase
VPNLAACTAKEPPKSAARDGRRVAYSTHLVESGADVKTVQELARHSDPRITLAVYAKARKERLANAAELVGRAVLAG